MDVRVKIDKVDALGLCDGLCSFVESHDSLVVDRSGTVVARCGAKDCDGGTRGERYPLRTAESVFVSSTPNPSNETCTETNEIPSKIHKWTALTAIGHTQTTTCSCSSKIPNMQQNMHKSETTHSALLYALSCVFVDAGKS